MLIRSQDREMLINFRNVSYLEKRNYDIYAFIGTQHYEKLGEYSSHEKARKVLDEIQEKHLEPMVTSMYSDGENFTYPSKAYQMPQDSEVEE